MISGIRNSDTFMLFLSAKVFTRRWVRFELITAIKMEKPIVLIAKRDVARTRFDFDALDKDEIVPLIAEGESPTFNQKYFSNGKTFRDTIKWLLNHSQSIMFQRFDPYEDAMISWMVRAATDKRDLDERKDVSKRLKVEMESWMASASVEESEKEESRSERSRSVESRESDDEIS